MTTRVDLFAGDGYYDIIQHFAQPFVMSSRKIGLGECLRLMYTMISMSKGSFISFKGYLGFMQCSIFAMFDQSNYYRNCNVASGYMDAIVTVGVSLQCILLFRLSAIKPITVISCKYLPLNCNFQVYKRVLEVQNTQIFACFTCFRL